MEAFAAIRSLSEAVSLIGLSSARVAVALLLVPLFTAQLVPGTVRNALFVSIALLSLALHGPGTAPVAAGWPLVSALAREAFIGGVIGFLFASMMWAFEAAGRLIDTKVGTTQAQVQDPMSGEQTTLNGALFGRLASYVFMAGGGMMVMTGTLLESFALWPVGAAWPTLELGDTALFEGEFGRLMRIALLAAAPALVVLYVLEGVLGLINRFAPQLNVFSLSLSLKAVAATAVILLQIGMLVAMLQDELIGRGAVVGQALRALLGG